MPISLNQLAWAQDFLKTHDYKILGNAKTIRDRPWSCVSCFETDKGPLYLKSMAQPYANEGILLLFLAQKGITNITTVIAHNPAFSCFLMKGAGWPLRKIQTIDFNEDIFCRFLKHYTQIQINCIPLVDQLLSIGVPDWRLHRLPYLYRDFINKTELLENDSLTPKEITILHELSPHMNVLCQELAGFNIPETLEHGDFHDNNILIEGDQITINDWGDAFLSHPFLSLAAALDSARRNHNLQETDQGYRQAREAYLSQWQDFANLDNLMKASNMAQHLHFFVFAMGFSRIYDCPGIENFPKFKGYVTESLRNFIQTAKEYTP